eukprot:TRINITY_DN15106_c0_g2_i1.p1 TRINITY_DN15106_c0_g2~~TRINITY_DN15106_c0_g2_i1.p1  ORF type:complete len:993 (-),score=76.72 TRINITY_DN15106_c0_g2_i1:103-3081(-)
MWKFVAGCHIFGTARLGRAAGAGSQLPVDLPGRSTRQTSHVVHGTQVEPKAPRDGDAECWSEDFNYDMCCGGRWGLTGNPVCWSGEFTYLRCCGLSAFPRRAEEDATWEDFLKEQVAQDLGEFDFVVVGAGSAGSVVAARLAAASGPDGPLRVLLLEDGPRNKDELTADPDNPPAHPDMWTTRKSVNWTFGEQRKETWHYATGRGLGGTAAVNCMIYTRGSTSEYHTFGWSEGGVRDAFKSLEAYMDVPGFSPDPRFHRSADDHARSSGYHLSLIAPTPEELPPLFQGVLQGFASAGIPYRLDPHGSSTIHGVGGVWRSMGCAHPDCLPARVSRMRFVSGRPRSSTYKTLVAPLNESGGHSLTILPHTRVDRIVFDRDRKAVAVEAVSATDAEQAEKIQRRVSIRVKNEVILSAGVFASPSILMRSGVGEPQELKRLQIPLTSASPEVGRNLMEHVGFSIVGSTNIPCPAGYHGNSAGEETHLGNTYQFIGQLYAFLNATDNILGQDGPLDGEIMILEGCMEGVLSLTFTIIQLQSDTRGRVVVQSKSPFSDPHLDYMPLSHSEDMIKLTNMVRLLYTKVFNAPALAPFELAVTPSWEIVADFYKLAQWVRANLYHYAHPSGTCRIQQDGSSGVVDSSLRVIGTHGLRVADASVFPSSPSGHFDAPSRLVGEMASRFILQDLDAAAGVAEPSSGGPFIHLSGYRGVFMPLRGLGTNGFEGDKVIANIQKFLRHGGRMIDTAALYNNHADIRKAIEASALPRSEIFIVSKIPPMNMGREEAAKVIDQMVTELGTHVDLVLIHWPANFQADAPVPPCARPPGSWRACRFATWQAMEKAHKQGQVRALGVSNFGSRHLQELLAEPGRKLPVAANEVEFHPWWPQPSLRSFCAKHHISLIAYGSTGGSLMGGAMLKAPSVMQAAAAVQRSPAQVLLRWAMQQGVAVIPASTSGAHIEENLDLVEWSLPDGVLQSISLAVDPASRMRVYMPDPENAP